MSAAESSADAARRELGTEFEGELIGPGDASYDEARALFNAMIDKRPAVIARCASVDDVAARSRFARAHDLPLAIRGGGHNGGGLGSVDDGVVADLSLLNSVSVDPTRGRFASAEAHLGRGGRGHARARPRRAVRDHLHDRRRRADARRRHRPPHARVRPDDRQPARRGVVLADGRARDGERRRERELFWALRGGGGNFGVVTEFTFRAHPVSDVVGGPTFWPIEDADELLAAYREYLPTLPRNVGAFFNFHTIPPGPPFPEEIHLRKVCGIVWCIVGSDEEAEQAMAPMLEVGDAADARRRAGAATRAEQRVRRPLRAGRPVVLARRLRQRDPRRGDRPERGVERAACRAGSRARTSIRSTARRTTSAADETPWAYRDTRWSQVIVGVDTDPASAPALRDWAVGYWEAVHPYSAGGAYVNFMMDEGQERVKATYGDNYDRLARAKADLRPGERLPRQPEHPAGWGRTPS